MLPGSFEQSPGFSLQVAVRIQELMTIREDLYGGVIRLINRVSTKNGYEIEYADTTNPESLLTYPVTQTHPDVPEEQREKLGITDKLLRMSVWIENPADIIRDLGRAFEEAARELQT